MKHDQTDGIHFMPLDLPNGARLKNRLIKLAMSGSLGDGRGDHTPAQIRLCEKCAEGGVAASIIGEEVQGDPRFPEKTGNLVIDDASDTEAFRQLARPGVAQG